MTRPDEVFDAFFTTKESGMGMGLAICRSIVDAHQGRIWATPAEGSGTILSFTLPVQHGNES
jgi:signal transduction histidine kinase